MLTAGQIGAFRISANMPKCRSSDSTARKCQKPPYDGTGILSEQKNVRKRPNAHEHVPTTNTAEQTPSPHVFTHIAN